MVVRQLSRSRSSVVALGALTTLTAGLLVLTPDARASQTPAVSITSLVDGAAPFSAGDDAGEDSSATNGRVRAGDPVTLDVRVVPGGSGSGLSESSVIVDVVAGKSAVAWSALPAGCLPGAELGTVQCDLGPRTVNEPIDLTFSGTAVERSVAGDLATSISVATGGTPTTAPLVVTTAALSATPVFTEPRLEGAVTVDGVDGLVLVYGLHVVAPPATALVSAADGTTFSLDLDASAIPGAVLLGCSANGADGGAVVHSAAVSEARTALDADAAARVGTGGTWACSPEGHVTITGVDTNPDAFPATAWDRTVLEATGSVLSAGAVRVFVPTASIGSGLTAAISASAISAPAAIGAGTTRQDLVTVDGVGEATPALLVIHTVNGVLAPTAPGAQVAPASPLQYVATVINTGDVTLSDLTATDPAVPALALTADGPLAPGASWSFTYDAIQPDGLLVSTLTVAGVAGDSDITGSDLAHSVVPVADPLTLPAPGVGTPAQAGNKVEITVYVNGQEFTSLPGPIAVIGTPNLVEYEVRNISSAAISNVVIDDSSITNDATAIDCGDDVTTKNKITALAVNEAVTCTQLVQPTTTTSATFTASATVNSVADASLATGYQTKAATVDLELSVNGQDADASPGASVVTGAVLTFSYVLRNTGQIDLATVEITHEDDDNGDFSDIACGSIGDDTDNDAVIDVLKVGESVNCTFSPTAVAGAFTTKAVAVGNPITADETVLENLDGAIEVTDNDPVFYTGSSTGGTTGTTLDPTVTATGTIGDGGANSGPLALVSGLVFLAGFGLWGVSRRRRFAR